MRSVSVLIALLLAVTAPMHESHAATFITFDDIPSGSRQDADGPVYFHQGFDFSGNLYWIDVVGGYEGWAHGSHSGDFALLNIVMDQGAIRRIARDDFTFDGLWAKRWRTPPESGGPETLFGNLTGLRDGEVVWTVPTGLNGSYKYFEPQPGFIDELVLGFGGAFLVDDILLNAHISAEPIPGDFDWNYVVDEADLLQWKDDFGNTPDSDADLDGDSDGNDFLIWQRQFGTRTTVATEVPEPKHWHLAAIAMAFLPTLRLSRSSLGRLIGGQNGRHEFRQSL